MLQQRRMVSSGMLRFVALLRTDVSEERIASIIWVTRIDELGTTLAVTSKRSTMPRNAHYSSILTYSSYILVTLMMEATRYSETLALTRATRRSIPKGGILHSHRRENLKIYRE
jgi:hypothetical protein